MLFTLPVPNQSCCDIDEKKGTGIIGSIFRSFSIFCIVKILFASLLGTKTPEGEDIFCVSSRQLIPVIPS